MRGDGGLYVVDFVYVWSGIDLFVLFDVFIIYQVEFVCWDLCMQGESFYT
jgi:hypothetical protein